MDESERLVAIAALAGPDRAREAWQTWRATVRIEDATGLLVWSAGYIHRNLATAGVSDSYLAGIHRHNLIANSRRLVEVLPLIREVAERWTIVPLKGFARTSIASRGLRPVADFDFYVDASEVDAVRAFLSERGFAPMLGADEIEFRSRIFRQRGSWSYLGTGGEDLDIHWRIYDHLSIAANRRLVATHSVEADTEYGRVRLLDDTTMALLLIAHQRTDYSGRHNLLFDAYHMLRSIDPDEVVALAAQVGMNRPIVDFVAEVRSIVGDDTHAAFDKLEPGARNAVQSEPDWTQRVARPRFGERVPPRYRQPELLAHPRLYRLWDALGQSWRLERALSRLGPATSIDAAQNPGPDGYPRGGGKLGIGWHHQYPADQFRWASVPDTRILLPAQPDSTVVHIELDAETWAGVLEPSVNVLVNGHRVGRIRKRDNVVDFPLLQKPSGDIVEVCLRPAQEEEFTTPGIFELWLRLLAPVRRIELR